MTNDNTQFFALKLKTGESLFTELVGVSDSSVIIRKPMIISEQPTNEGLSLSLQQWLPYVESDSEISIPSDVVYLVEPLSKKHIKFYGAVLLQTEIQRIKDDSFENFSGDDKIDYYEMMLAVQKIDALSEFMSNKFGIDRVDTSSFIEKSEKHKPMLH
jgi:hypothetical protein